MIRDTLISLELAILALENNFDCYGYSAFMYEAKWHEDTDFYELEDVGYLIPDKYWNAKLKICPQSVLAKWFREIHGLHIFIDTTPRFDNTHPSKWKSQIKEPFRPFRWTTGKYYLGETYEEALEKAMLEAFKLIKNK